LRRLRIAAPVQLPLDLPELPVGPTQRWATLPESARHTVLVLLARLISRGVLDEEDVVDD
jgi:hypothetical protein